MLNLFSLGMSTKDMESCTLVRPVPLEIPTTVFWWPLGLGMRVLTI